MSALILQDYKDQIRWIRYPQKETEYFLGHFEGAEMSYPFKNEIYSYAIDGEKIVVVYRLTEEEKRRITGGWS